MKVWNAFVLLWYVPLAGCFERGDEPSDSIKGGKS
jgi:hypothetical protein